MFDRLPPKHQMKKLNYYIKKSLWILLCILILFPFAVIIRVLSDVFYVLAEIFSYFDHELEAFDKDLGKRLQRFYKNNIQKRI